MYDHLEYYWKNKSTLNYVCRSQVPATFAVPLTFPSHPGSLSSGQVLQKWSKRVLKEDQEGEEPLHEPDSFSRRKSRKAFHFIFHSLEL